MLSCVRARLPWDLPMEGINMRGSQRPREQCRKTIQKTPWRGLASHSRHPGQLALQTRRMQVHSLPITSTLAMCTHERLKKCTGHYQFLNLGRAHIA